jgi:hypothetical protein
MVTEVAKFIYLESEMNSAGKTERDINIKIQNNPKFYQIIKEAYGTETSHS